MTAPDELLRLARERIERDVDPAYVAASMERKAAWAKRIGHPKRCETNQVHPGLGCCLYCGADSGENCRARYQDKGR